MIERQRMCFCWLPWGKVEQYVREHCDEEGRLPEIRKRWLAAHKQYAQLVIDEKELGKTTGTKKLPAKFAAKAAELMQEEAFTRTFYKFPTRILLVEIDKLVVLQHTVVLDYIDRIELPEEITMDVLFDLCLKTGKEAQVRTARLGNNAMLFDAESKCFRFLGNLQRSLQEHAVPIGGVPMHELALVFGFGHPAATAYHMDGRFYLNNGLHRAFTLRRRGVKYMPLIVQEVDDPAAFASTYFGVSKEFLLRAPRLPLLKEFFTPGLTIDLNGIAKRRVIKLSWTIDEMDVPVEQFAEK